MRLTILGCGASTGVPMIGCHCAICTSDNPRNQRTRASVLFEDDAGHRLLIDASPDLREQALRHDIHSIDGLVITHAHADHCHGIDEIRSFNVHKNAVIPFVTDTATYAEVGRRFAYAFAEHTHDYGWYKPAFDVSIIDVTDTPIVSHRIAEMDIRLMRQWHGRQTSLAIRIGDIAYSPDVNHLEPDVMAALHGLDMWVVDCLRHAPSPTHAHLEMTLGWIEELRPARAILTHMGHDFDYANPPPLPANVALAYDGMIITA